MSSIDKNDIKMFVDKLLSFKSKIIQIKYLISENIDLNKFTLIVNEYEKSYSNNDGLIEIYNYYKSYVDGSKKQVIDNMLRNLDRAVNFFEDIINSGNNMYYDVNLYIEDLAVRTGLQYSKLKDDYKGFRRILNDVGLYDYYRECLDEMRKKAYINLKPIIDDFVSKARFNKVDILDFCLIFNMTFERFKTLCNGLISSTEMMQFNILFSPYIRGFYDVNLSEKIIQNTKYSFVIDGEEVYVSDQDKQDVIEFLNNNNIPLNLFPVAIKRYIEGNLVIDNNKKSMC